MTNVNRHRQANLVHQGKHLLLKSMFMRSSLGHRKVQKSDIDEVKILGLNSLIE